MIMATMKEALTTLNNPDIKHIVSVSGGKDSAALAIYMKENYPQIPVEYVFCDTLCELPETDAYLKRLESYLEAKINRVDALEMLGIRKRRNRDGKQRNPFDIFLNDVYGGFLPSPRTRWCTIQLKIKPFEAYVGNSHVYSYIGIRGDEDREGYKTAKNPVLSKRPNITPVYPFKDDKVGLQEVKDILNKSGLGLPTYYEWRSRSGCYFCFYQQIGEWQGLKEHHPDLFEKAKEFEKFENGKKYTWCEGKTLDEVVNRERKDILAPDDADGCAICHL
jgi:3'-phosphoadenosine 5'-phosphosulfate sulfotransferase (PAPS reductase)/FAD synthetase